MKKILALLVAYLILFATTTGCGSKKTVASPVNLTVSAASSLKDAAVELKTIYEQQNPGITITYNFAASGTLQKQIEEGAPVDLFISAGQAQMDALTGKGLVLEGSRKNLLGNDLVLIAKNDSQLTSFKELVSQSVARISIGAPEIVPAGNYAREALTSLGIWDSIQTKLVLAKDVRQVLTYVETGNVDAGLVYRSDALTGKSIKVVDTAPAGSHKPIVYPMGVIKSTSYQKQVIAFASFLTGNEASRVFEKYGFKTLKE